MATPSFEHVQWMSFTLQQQDGTTHPEEEIVENHDNMFFYSALSRNTCIY